MFVRLYFNGGSDHVMFFPLWLDGYVTLMTSLCWIGFALVLKALLLCEVHSTSTSFTWFKWYCCWKIYGKGILSVSLALLWVCIRMSKTHRCCKDFSLGFMTFLLLLYSFGCVCCNLSNSILSLFACQIVKNSFTFFHRVDQMMFTWSICY